MAEAYFAEPDVEGTAKLLTRLSVEQEPIPTLEGIKSSSQIVPSHVQIVPNQIVPQ